ncbi:N-acetylneuraminate synthase family protein [Halalkalibacter alkalisediminis]|uniref:N-acetylneuraminate synthase family protein n=1 Tax=Halalkalibacter alkalisediminis TaxID=935616 RepID=A0ABV6NMD4_9BACI|nr:N-acetylneuraminate synthase family protein [Halalkalibacter alkalisediminis]
MSYFLYAETAFHHEGDYNYLISLIDSAAEIGCHGIKFQILLDLNDFMSSLHPDFYKVKEWMFSSKQWIELLEYSNSKGLEIVAMPCDLTAVNLIESLPFTIKYYDIHSVSFCDKKLLSAIKDTGKKVILGVGGRTFSEIISACDFFEKQLTTLMVGFQSYPSNLSDVMIGKIRSLKELFPELIIGYADHTLYNNDYVVKSLEYAYILGARVFEKHITLQEGIKRVDYESAVSKHKFKKMKRNLDYLTQLLPEYNYKNFMFCNKEISYRNRQKILVALMDIRAGTKLTTYNTVLKMAGNINGFTSIEEIEGSKVIVDLKKDEPITREKIK